MISPVTRTVTHIGGRKYNWSVGDNGALEPEGKELDVDIQFISPHRVSVLINGRSFYAVVDSNGLKFDVLMAGRLYQAEVESPTKLIEKQLRGSPASRPTELEVRSPMPGMVVRCEVTAGTTIKIGDGLLVLEAMKMENEIRSTINGVVKKILVTDKQVVDKGELLLVIE